MQVTKDVIEDLIPVYLAGEASAGTKRLVEEFAAAAPDLARRLKAGADVDATPPALTPDVEVRALARTRRLLRLRGVVLGLAIWFTALPATIVHRNGRTWWLWRESPEYAALSLAAGIVLWVVYYTWGRRLKATGVV